MKNMYVKSGTPFNENGKTISSFGDNNVFKYKYYTWRKYKCNRND